MKINKAGLNYNLNRVYFDYNGTIANSGILIENIVDKLYKLKEKFEVIIISGDTYGNIQDTLKDFKVILAYTTDEKLKEIEKYKENAIAIGNGNIDYKMLKTAKLSFAVIGKEGCSRKAILNADIIVNDIFDVFDILEDENKIIATLKEIS